MFKPTATPHPFTPRLISIVRIITGTLMIYHGWQTFDAKALKGYGDWLNDLNVPAPYSMAYVGKISELLGGIFLVPGLFTRAASLLLIVVMIVIVFVMNHGRLFTQDQHPFLLLLLFSIFFFYGGGSISIDNYLKKNADR